jgi:hypothetical protein
MLGRVMVWSAALAEAWPQRMSPFPVVVYHPSARPAGPSHALTSAAVMLLLARRPAEL